MKEAVFILMVVGVLFALTVVRYRKKIVAGIQMWRMLRAAMGKRPQRQDEQLRDRSVPLVNCAKCSRWIPENEAILLGAKNYFCSRECFEQTANLR